MKITIIIPIYRNDRMVLKNIKGNLQFFNQCEVIIVNDWPDSEINQEIERLSPQIKLIRNQKNLGFAESVNIAAQQAKGDILFLLNSDAKLISDQYIKWSNSFVKDDTLFAVSFLQNDGNKVVGINSVFFSRGMFMHRGLDESTSVLNGWAEGGTCLVRKKYFDLLGGFDAIYKPYYWEDVDLSYRAYKRGWKVIHASDVFIDHTHESTIGKYFSKSCILTIAYRNQFIFMWKNITDIRLLMSHFYYLPYHILKHVIRTDYPFIKGFILALFKIPYIIKFRVRNESTYADQYILSLFQKDAR